MSALEELLRAELRTVARTAGEPEPRAADLARAGEVVKRRRRTRVVLTSAAVVLVVVGGLGVTGRLTSSAPKPGDPAGPASPGETPAEVGSTAVPYWSAGHLHVGGKRVMAPVTAMTYAGGTVLVDLAGGDRHLQWYRLGDSVPLMGMTGKVAGRPHLSPDGRLASWLLRSSPDQWLLQVVDARGGDLNDSTLVAEVTGTPRLLGLDTRGRVFVDVPGRGPVVWTPQTPGGPLVDVTGLPAGSRVERTWGDGVFLGGEADDSLGVFGSVDDTGLFRPEGEVSTHDLGLWSPDQLTWAFTGDDSGHPVEAGSSARVFVQRAGSDDVESLGLPALDWVVAGWEDSETVVVASAGLGVRVCSTRSLACHAVSGTSGAGLVVPGDYAS